MSRFNGLPLRFGINHVYQDNATQKTIQLPHGLQSFIESCCLAPAEMWFQHAMIFMGYKKLKIEQIGFTQNYFQIKKMNEKDSMFFVI